VDVFIDPPLSGAGASLLALGPDCETWSLIVQQLQASGHCCQQVNSPEAIQDQIASGGIDLVLLDPVACGEEGLALLSQLQQMAPKVKTIVATESKCLDTAMEAVRCGALDYLALPQELDAIVVRVEQAVAKMRAEQQRDKRLDQLKRICKELNTARHEISEQVDVLCKDLASAYEGMTEQMNDVAVAAEFKALLQQELDVEDVLRTMLEYLLTKTGPTNAAVYLPDGDKNFGLSAYVNYDCPEESLTTLLDHLCQAVCPQMVDETDIVSFEDSAEFASWVGMPTTVIADSDVVAYACRHEEECLAVVVLFRNRSEPFEASTAGILDLLRKPFAEQLGQIVKIHRRSKPHWPDEARNDELDFDDEYGFGIAA
jgi:DNA-binding response OmpR family regulator